MLGDALEVAAFPSLSLLETQGPESGKAQGSPSGGNTLEWERTHMRNVKGLPSVRQHVQKSVITNTLTGKEGKGDRFQRPSPGELQETVEDKMQANTVVPHLKQLSSDPGI